MNSNSPARLWSRRSSIVLVLALSVAGVIPAARADLPPYAEQWFTPGLPQDVQTDPFGRIWVGCLDDTVRVYSPTGGSLLFQFGGTGAGEGEFQNPDGIAFDAAGDAFICDYGGARVERFTSDGQFVLEWPIPSDRADHVALDSAGDVYVTGYTDLSVHKYTATGTPILDWATASEARTAGVLVVGGTVHVVLWTTPEVEQYDTGGNYLGSFPAATVAGLDVDVDPLGQLWVTDFGGHTVNVFASDGTPVGILGSLGFGPGEFNNPSGVAIGLDGSVYVADQGNGRVQRFGAPAAGAGEPHIDASSLEIRALGPNPCRTGVQVSYASARPMALRLVVTDVQGRTVTARDLSAGTAGVHHLGWDLRNAAGDPVASGIYFVRLTGGGEAHTRRLVVTR